MEFNTHQLFQNKPSKIHMQQVWLANGENQSLLHMKDLLCGHFLDTQYLGSARIDKFDPKVLKRRY